MSESNFAQLEHEKDLSQLMKIADDCEKTIKTTESEIYQYQHDKNKLRKEVFQILNENQALHSEYSKLKQLPEPNHEERHEKLTDNAIEKLKDQLQFLTEERDTLNTLWKSSQEVISNLETELNNYKHELKKPNTTSELTDKYQSTITLLEKTVTSVYNGLKSQKSENSKLLKNKQDLEIELKNSGNKCDELELKIKESSNFHSIIESLKNQLITVMHKNADLESLLKTTKTLVDERLKREHQALEKVQESLQLAEHAIMEKNEAINKESVMREECNYLATTILQVMDDAAIRVEKKIEKINSEHEKIVNSLKEEKNELEKLLEKEKQMKYDIEIRAEHLEKRLKESFDENNKLDSDLQLASQAIVELELKFESFQKLVVEDDNSNKMASSSVEEIKNYLESNKRLSARWKDLIDEITKNFEQEIEGLQNENSFLKIENQNLKLSINDYGVY